MSARGEGMCVCVYEGKVGMREIFMAYTDTINLVPLQRKAYGYR